MYENWRIQDLITWTTKFLAQKGIDNPRLETEVLLARVLNRDRVYLYSNFDKPVNKNERDLFRDYVKRRVKGEPVAYIVGNKEFMSLNFKVTPDVLIPRSDTEVLIEQILELVSSDAELKICDVGTGSGAIAVSLAYYLPKCTVYATDLSYKALEVAKENAAINKVDIYFLQGNLLTPVQNYGEFDIITANLPYVPIEEYEGLDLSVKGFEPVTALVGPGDGLDLYRKLVPQALDLLKAGGYLFCEIGYNQGKKALEIIKGFQDVELIKDLAGRDRVIKARKG